MKHSMSKVIHGNEYDQTIIEKIDRIISDFSMGNEVTHIVYSPCGKMALLVYTIRLNE